MSAADDANPKTISPLARLRSEIIECERFIALCDQIKHLEQLDERNSLQIKKQKLQQQRDQSLIQLGLVTSELQRYEQNLNVTDRPMGACEVDELNVCIRSAKTRLRSLQLFVNDATASMTAIDEATTKNAELLQQLYVQLEQIMESGALHPNTVRDRMQQLIQQRDLLSEAKKANIITRPNNARNHQSSARDKHDQPADGAPLDEETFFKCLVDDLQSTKKNVLIFSSDLSSQRAGELMPILGNLVAAGKNVTVYTRPTSDLSEPAKQESQSIITVAHRMRVTVMQQSGIQLGAAIIDGYICWEGSVNILGTNQPGKSMRRIIGGIKARELCQFLFEKRGPKP